MPSSSPSNFRICSPSHKETCTHEQSLPILPGANTWQVQIVFPSYGFAYFGHFVEMNLIIYDFLWPASFTYHILRDHFVVCIETSFFSFIAEQCATVRTRHMCFPFPCGRAFVLFPLFDCVSNAITRICVQALVWTCVFTFLVYMPRSGLAGSHGNSV